MRLTRRRPPDGLSPLMSLFAAAVILIGCCSAPVAGIPRQLSPEADENLGEGGGGATVFPFPVRPQQNEVVETEEGKQQKMKTLEEKNGDGKEEALEEEEEDDDDPGAEEEDEEDGEEEDEPDMAPPYMLELYRRFSTDKQSHPMADIVRSFKNINTGGVTSVWTSSNCTWTALHSLHFNISSEHDEDIRSAELRLRTSKKMLAVLVYEVIAPPPDSPPQSPPPQSPSPQSPPLLQPRFRLLTSREVSPERSSSSSSSPWQTFSVTEVLRRWAKEQTTPAGGHVFQVRVDTVHRSNDDDAASAGSDVTTDDETILVVFSNDRKKERRVSSRPRELREIQTQENEIREKENERRRRRRKRRYRRHVHPPLSHSSPTPLPSSPEEEEEEEEYSMSGRNSTDAAASKWRLSLRPSVAESLIEGRRTPGDPQGLRNRSRSRKRRRDSCRRKPMYVDFRDIKWENRIIKPPGYQAYECTGRCYFPIGRRLTPTKYALVKSLLHATYPKRSSAACCVPTRLEPIPLLYADEQGVVTYRPRYEDMVVAECGCR